MGVSDGNNKLISLYFEEKSKIALDFPIDNISLLYETVKNTYEADGVVYILGNGGSASIAEGFAVDLRTHPFVAEDKSITTNIRRLKVISLTESSGLLTGISNDVGFDYVFSEQMKNFSRSGEINNSSLLICLSAISIAFMTDSLLKLSFICKLYSEKSSGNKSFQYLWIIPATWFVKKVVNSGLNFIKEL